MIPPALSAAFVAAMEDLLAVDSRPPAPRRPLVCCDESGKALRGHVREPQPAAPGTPAREDTAYAREGSANLFLAGAPHLGWRGVQATAQRTAVDFAHAIRALTDGPFRAADGIVLVTDNLHTPTHGSWLNMAELALAALARQGLNRRRPDRATLARAVAAWAEARNRAQVRIDWRFGIDEARVKLAHCYPVPEQDMPAVSDY